MSCLIDVEYVFKGMKCVKLETEKYLAVVSPETGGAVLRFYDKANRIEIFRYREDCTAKKINEARVLWGLPTLYLANRFDGGVIKTSDGLYRLPINEEDLGNFLHGWVHNRSHSVEETYADEHKAVVKTCFCHDACDEMYKYFPLDFKISYTFTLSDEKGLEQEICLENKSDKMLPVSICTHTCINAPMTEGGREEAMRLCVPAEKKCELDERCLPTERLLELNDWDNEYKNGTKRPTLQVISNDMYTACMNSLDGKDFYGAVITDTDTGHRILNEVSKEFKFWNMWNDNGDKGYFCPEPMTAMINSPNLSLPREVSGRSEERRVGKECRSRWSPYH